MRNFIALFCLILCLCVCVGANSEDAVVKPYASFSAPDDWEPINTENVFKVVHIYNFAERYEALKAEGKGMLVLLPTSTADKIETCLEVSFDTMESYHRDYSTMTEEQLNNVGLSFLRSGDYSSFEVVKTEKGSQLLKLRSDTTKSLDSVYVTNKHGTIMTLRCYGDWSASETVDTVYYIVDSMGGNEKNTNWLDTLMQYRAFLTIPLGCLVVILLNSRKRKQQ